MIKLASELFVVYNDNEKFFEGTEQDCVSWLNSHGYRSYTNISDFQLIRARINLFSDIGIKPYIDFYWKDFEDKNNKQIKNGM